MASSCAASHKVMRNAWSPVSIITPARGASTHELLPLALALPLLESSSEDSLSAGQTMGSISSCGNRVCARA